MTDDEIRTMLLTVGELESSDPSITRDVEIEQLNFKGLSRIELAKMYGVSASLIIKPIVENEE